jgi:hypothetical protein
VQGPNRVWAEKQVMDLIPRARRARPEADSRSSRRNYRKPTRLQTHPTCPGPEETLPATGYGPATAVAIGVPSLSLSLSCSLSLNRQGAFRVWTDRHSFRSETLHPALPRGVECPRSLPPAPTHSVRPRVESLHLGFKTRVPLPRQKPAARQRESPLTPEDIPWPRCLTRDPVPSLPHPY